MSRSLSVPIRGSRAAVAGALALVTALLMALSLVPQADAAFTTAKCAGTEITGRGASFARDAHNAFINNFGPFYCGKTPPTVTYEALGSGEGRLAAKARNLPPRFGMSDEPPSPTEVNEMNAGGTAAGSPLVFTPDADPANDGKVHVIPAAVGAVAALVNFPNGCEATDLPDASKTSLDAKLIRVRFTKAQFEAVWAQGGSDNGTEPYVTWRDVFPALDDNAACKSPVIRVVRKDDSGTTFAFKDYLNAIDPAEKWLEKYAATTGNKTLEWPGAEFGNGGQCGATNAPGKLADTVDHLTSSCSNNAENLTQKLIDTDGSIGYADISTARAKGLAVNPAGGDVDVYWTQVQNGSGTFTEPTFSANGFQTTGAKGANCQGATFKNVPTSTLGDWSKVSGVNSANGYGICSFTYGLVFDDNAEVWGNSPSEEAMARTVKDYWGNIVSTEAQAGLFPNDYAPLPADILTMSRAGVDAIGWNKENDGEVIVDPPPPPPPPTNDKPVTPQKPSNQFSLLRKKISSKTGGATISVKLPGAGQLEMVATAKVGKKQVKVGRVVLSANQAGSFDLKLNPSAAAKQRLKKKGSLKVTLTLTFTPTGGDANADTDTVTLKLVQKPKG